ncbi:MAG TPA: hypothetical protein VFP84_24365 [Kofleriaceae bacterium]|nr:hypothetical protein [Kofleriaceae bacterium]
MTRGIAALISVVLVAVVLEPVIRRPDDDGFPLSTFPMFAAARPSKLAMMYAQGMTGAGEPRTLRPEHLGTGEVMQAYAMLQSAAARGEPASSALCTAIAARVAVDDDYDDVASIRLVWASHDAVDYLARGAVSDETVRATCPVPHDEAMRPADEAQR